jgi:hypothetical protein
MRNVKHDGAGHDIMIICRHALIRVVALVVSYNGIITRAREHFAGTKWTPRDAASHRPMDGPIKSHASASHSSAACCDPLRLSPTGTHVSRVWLPTAHGGFRTAVIMVAEICERIEICTDSYMISVRGRAFFRAVSSSLSSSSYCPGGQKGRSSGDTSATVGCQVQGWKPVTGKRPCRRFWFQDAYWSDIIGG